MCVDYCWFFSRMESVGVELDFLPASVGVETDAKRISVYIATFSDGERRG